MPPAEVFYSGGEDAPVAVILESSSEKYLRNNFVISAGTLEGLKRINQSGVERAQAALAGFLGRDEPILLESISILPLTMLSRRLRQTKQDHLGCHLRIFGELQGEIYCYLPKRHAVYLASTLYRQGSMRQWIGRNLELSALSEINKVFATAYWQALHGHVPLDWRTTVPASTQRVEHLFGLASRIGHYDYLVFHSDLILPIRGIHLYFCLIPGVDCLNRFLTSLDAGKLRPLVSYN